MWYVLPSNTQLGSEHQCKSGILFSSASGISNPNPDESMALGDRVNPYARILVNSLLAGHPYALAFLVKLKPMIFADEVVAFKGAFRQRQQTVRAAIFKRTQCAIRLAVEHNWFTANRASKRSAFDFMVPSRGVPAILQEH